jgi:lambda family phage portal protein
MSYFRTLASAFLGKPMAALPSSGFFGAGGGRRALNIGTTTRGASSLALAEAPILLGRARKADLDNPMARTGVTAFVSEAIGTGIRPHSKHTNADKRRLLEKEFALWVPQASAVRRIGPGGVPDSLQDLYLLESLVCRNTVVAGEAFARLRPRLKSDLSPAGLRVPLQVELIEPEQLAWWRTTGDVGSPKNLIRGGIEFDQVHQRVAYHFYREHPGDSAIWPNGYEITRVPAQSILHVMEFLQGAQIRGITTLAPIIVALADLDDFDDSERFRQKLGSYLFGWKKTLNPDGDPLNVASTTTAGTDQAPQGAAYVESQPGQVTLFDTNQNEDFGFYSHPGVANTYEAFLRVQRQTISAAMRISYDMLTGDMNQVNYSSARIRLIALRRVWEQYQQQVMVQQFCRPLWRAWLDAAALAGVINATDYEKNPEEYLNVEWSGQPWEWVDPKTDVESVRMEIESALASREEHVAKRGKSVEEVDEAIKRDHDREEKLGIVPVYGQSRVNEVAPPGDNGDLATAGQVQPKGRE